MMWTTLGITMNNNENKSPKNFSSTLSMKLFTTYQYSKASKNYAVATYSIVIPVFHTPNSNKFLYTEI
jgi:hypothetical protein